MGILENIAESNRFLFLSNVASEDVEYIGDLYDILIESKMSPVITGEELCIILSELNDHGVQMPEGSILSLIKDGYLNEKGLPGIHTDTDGNFIIEL